MRRTCTLIAVGLAVVACGDTLSPLRTAASEVDAHQREWSLFRIHDYAFDYQRIPGNIGPTGYTFDPMRIEVRADRIASVTDVRTGAVVSPLAWPTIDSLFAHARAAVAGSDHGDGTTSARISYDPRYAFPTAVSSGIPDTGGEQASDLQKR